MRYFIETSTIIDFLRGDKQTVESVLSLSGELVSSYVCLAELHEGIYRIGEESKEAEGIKDFFNGLSFVYGLDEEISKQFGQIRLHLKQEGNVIEDLDILIASTCKAHGLVLVTKNTKHFSRIPNLQMC